MARRRTIRSGKKDVSETVRIGGPKKYLNKIVKKVGWGKTKYSYVSISAPWYKNAINEVKSARQRKHLSQRNLATLLGSTQSEVSRFENGKSNPTVDFLDRLFATLDLDLKISAKKLKKWIYVRTYTIPKIIIVKNIG